MHFVMAKNVCNSSTVLTNNDISKHSLEWNECVSVMAITTLYFIPWPPQKRSYRTIISVKVNKVGKDVLKNLIHYIANDILWSLILELLKVGLMKYR